MGNTVQQCATQVNTEQPREAGYNTEQHPPGAESTARVERPPEGGPWYHGHTGRKSETLRIYPHGFAIETERSRIVPPPVSPDRKPRGEILGLSPAAAGRLRAFCLTMYVKGCDVWAGTFTTRGETTPEQFRSIEKRFRNMMRYYEIPAIWRVELQRRGVPHLHCALFLPRDTDRLCRAYQVIQKCWLKATREHDDPASRRHAVDLRWIGPSDNEDQAGWLVYLSLHQGKAKESQLGWKGKQWGIWNRDSFEPRPPKEIRRMSDREMVLFARRLRAWSRHRFKGRVSRPWRVHAHKPRRLMVPATKVEQLARGLGEPSTDPTVQVTD